MRINVIVAALFVLGSLASSEPTAAAANRTTSDETPPELGGTIAGVVIDRSSKEAIKDALVILQCTCLDGNREMTTNDNGLYAFGKLPPGEYTVQILFGKVDVSKVVSLPGNARFRANFKIDPANEFRRVIRVEKSRGDRSLFARSSGISLAGTTSAEASYSVEGAGVNLPSSGKRQRRSPRDRLRQMREIAVELDSAVSSGVTRNTAAAPPKLEAEPAHQVDADAIAHRIIYSGTMQVAVFHLAEAMESTEKITREAGGYVQKMVPGQFLLRIPAEKFRATMAEIGELGRIDYQAIESEDVTEQYYDLDTRIAVLRKTQEQLMELLDKARTVKEALRVRESLDRVTMELEQALGKQRVLDSRVRYSVLQVSLAERLAEHELPSSNDPFPWVDSIGVESTEWR